MDAAIAAVGVMLSFSGVARAGVADDPMLRRFTGLRIVERSGGVAGAQAFFFQRFEATTTVTATDRYITTRTERSRKKLLVAFRLGERGNGVFCDAVSFGEQDEDPAFNPWTEIGNAFGRVALSMAGGGEWSGSRTDWAPFNPALYATWVETKWLPWRRGHLAAEDDPLVEALALCDAGRARDAKSFLEEAVAHFGYQTRRSWGGAEDPEQTTCYVPELFARLGDAERSEENWRRAEELYRVACTNPPPFLDDVRGIALAHRGLGLCLARRALAASGDTAPIGRDAALHLRAYLGYFGDRTAPDSEEIRNIISRVDPGVLRRRAEEAAAEETYQRALREQREFRERSREVMEY
jgi:hypothetical protein